VAALPTDLTVFHELLLAVNLIVLGRFATLRVGGRNLSFNIPPIASQVKLALRFPSCFNNHDCNAQSIAVTARSTPAFPRFLSSRSISVALVAFFR
jgi:hypothetical protein